MKKTSGLSAINITIAADTVNYDLFAAAGSPTADHIINLTINGTGGGVSGAGGKVVVGCSSYAFKIVGNLAGTNQITGIADTSYVPVGTLIYNLWNGSANVTGTVIAKTSSTVTLNMVALSSGSGLIFECFGGGSAISVYGFTAGSVVNIINNGYIVGAGGPGGSGDSGSYITTNGTAGGTAITLGNNVNINNTSGYIFGGGGGGGESMVMDYIACGGGGGQGYSGGYSGAGDASTDGGSGTFASPGAGGHWNGYLYGATGGTWGSAGANGATGDLNSYGGAGGKAINLNGKAVTWLGGNNGTQVKGAVS